MVNRHIAMLLHYHAYRYSRNTPILRGVDAENFVRNLYAEKKPDKKRQERMAKNYEYLCRIASFKIK